MLLPNRTRICKSGKHIRKTCATNFLVQTLGVERHIAEKDACRIEHIISERTFNLIKEKY